MPFLWLVVIGQTSADEGDTRGALQWRKASYVLSIVGIAVGTIVVIVVLVLFYLKLAHIHHDLDENNHTHFS